MSEIMHEGGMAPWVVLVAFVAGLAAVVTVGRRAGRPGSVAACFAVFMLAFAAFGYGTGQRNVDNAVRGVRLSLSNPRPDFSQKEVVERLEILSIGNREAAANMLFGGAAASLLMLVGGVLSLAASRKAPPAA